MILVDFAHEEPISQQLEECIEVAEHKEGQRDDMAPLRALNQAEKLVTNHRACEKHQPIHNPHWLVKQHLKRPGRSKTCNIDMNITSNGKSKCNDLKY